MKKYIVLGVIPARYNSSRLPGKPLLPIQGKSLIQRVYENASRSKFLDKILVATDDRRIKEGVVEFGGQVVITSNRPRSGSDRVAEAVKGLNYDLVLNIQCDEAFMNPKMLDQLIDFMRKNKNVQMGTLARRVNDDDFFTNPGRVKVVLDKDGNALYFSRFPIPYQRGNGKKGINYYEHIGIYAFRKGFLSKYAKLKQTPLEKAESLEQLRALENGYKIKVFLTGYESKTINSHSDLKKINKKEKN
jgi:3-deoxy-manno-octulosonate cytidylyltransferase (CMP-KDO synthetase)